MNPSDLDKNGGSPSAYARYPPLERTGSREEQPRDSRARAAPPTWERSGHGQEDHRVVAGERPRPTPGALRYGDSYGGASTNHQAPHHDAWPGGRPRRDSFAGGAAAVQAAQASKYVDERDDPYASQEQWRDQDEGDAEDEDWEGRAQYAAHHATRAEHPAYRRQTSPGWPDEPAGVHRPLAGYVDGSDGGGQRPSVRRDVVRGPAAGRPRERRDDHYEDEETGDIIGSKRRLPLPPGGGRDVPTANGRSAWNEPPRSTVAGAVPASSREDFEKEVMRQAALLVAERELRVRQESRQQVKDKKEWSEEPARPHRREGREVVRERASSSTAHSHTMDRRRTRSVEDADKRRSGNDSREHRQQDTQRDRGRTADRGNKWQQDVAGEGWRDNKKARHDDRSPPRSGKIRSDERSGNGRANVTSNSRADERAGGGGRSNFRRDVRADDRYANNHTKMKHYTKHDEDDGRVSKMPPRDDSRGVNRDAERERRREDDTRKPKEDNRPRHDSRVLTGNTHPWEKDNLATRAPGRSSTWNANKRANSAVEDEKRAKKASAADPAGKKEPASGVSLGKMWEPSTADTGFYVHVGGVSFSTTFTTLAKRFAAFGDVNGFKVIFNKVSCRTGGSGGGGGGGGKTREDAIKPAVVTASTGFAFISFDNEEGMEKAIVGMDNQVLDGHLLKVRTGKEEERVERKALTLFEGAQRFVLRGFDFLCDVCRVFV